MFSSISSTSPRNKRLAVAAVAVGTVAALSTLPGTTATANGDNGETITVKQEELSFRFIDVPPKAKSPDAPASPGDMILIVNRVIMDDDWVGSLHASCVATRRVGNAANSPYLCDGVWKLRGGTISGITVIRPKNQRFAIAITGGTGKYDGASGTGIERVTGEGTSTVTMHLRGE